MEAYTLTSETHTVGSHKVDKKCVENEARVADCLLLSTESLLYDLRQKFFDFLAFVPSHRAHCNIILLPSGCDTQTAMSGVNFTVKQPFWVGKMTSGERQTVDQS